MSRVILYTMAGCKNCHKLKDYLEKSNIIYEEKKIDIETQVELIMMNIFSDPPILEANGKTLTPDRMFDKDVLSESKVSMFLHNGQQEVKA